MINTEKVLKYGAIGLGSALVGYALFRPSRAEARYAQRLTKFTRRSEIPKLTKLNGPAGTSNQNSAYPAIMMHYNAETDDYEFFKLNFTPRRLSASPVGNLIDDAEFFEAHGQVTDDVEREYERLDFNIFRSNPDRMIHPVDYRILEMTGFIPSRFPIAQTAYVRSYNGINEFIVGYSAPFATSGKRGKFNVIRPLWAVSFGKDFNPAPYPSREFVRNDQPGVFRDMGERMLYAEFLLSNSGKDGCHRGQARSMCDMERNALLGLMLERLKIKRIKHERPNLSWYEGIFDGDGIDWNNGGLFMASFNGYADCHRCTQAERRRGKCPNNSCKNWRSFRPLRKALPQNVQKRFDAYYGTSFWQLPKLGVNATNFFHPNSLSSRDKSGNALQYSEWMLSGLPPTANQHVYPSQHPILIGESVVTDRGRRFK